MNDVLTVARGCRGGKYRPLEFLLMETGPGPEKVKSPGEPRLSTTSSRMLCYFRSVASVISPLAIAA